LTFDAFIPKSSNIWIIWRRYLSNSGLNSIIFDALNTICLELLESLKYPSSSNIAPRN
jgi:hypothetical protein